MKRKDGKTPPVYVIFGSDSFLRLQALDDVITSVLGADRDNMAIAEFDGRSAEWVAVVDECRTMSLLAPTRLICVRNADDFVKTHRKKLEEYVQAPSSSGVLVLECERWDDKWILAKLVAKTGRTLACKPPAKRRGLADWAVSHADRTYDCKLDSAAAYRLIELVGDELGRLDMEIAKLTTFVAPRTTVRLADVEGLVGASRAEKVFGITDAIARRDAPGALTLWDQVLANDRDAPYRAVGGLAFGFRKLVEGKRMIEQGRPVAEAARRINPWADPAGVKRQLDRFSLPQWQDHLVQLLRIDVGAKTGLGTVRSAVEKMIVTLCSAP